MRLNTYSFSLAIASHSDFDDDLADQVFECGCDDGCLSARNGELFLGIDRESTSLTEAIASAVRQLQWEAIHVSHAILPDNSTIAIVPEGMEPILTPVVGERLNGYRPHAFTLVFDGVFDKALANELYGTEQVEMVLSRKGKSYVCIEVCDVTLVAAKENAIWQLNRKFGIKALSAYEERYEGDESYICGIHLGKDD